MTAPRDPMVLVRGACKSFSARTGLVAALVEVDLRIPDGSFFTLLGPSGCGKTTLLRVLAGFETLDSGTVLLAGRDVAGEPPHRRPVNIVFQSYALFPHLTVAENVAFGLKRQGRPRAEVAARTRTMLDLVRLGAMAARRPPELSGGQQQRVALARALAPGPKLLLLDEPLSALDRGLRHEMQGELKLLQRDSGITFLLVTHDQEEALSLSDDVAVMNGGRVLQCGTPAEIHGRPACRFVAEFMGGNVLPGRMAGVDAALAAIRPEAVDLDRPGQPDLLDGRLIETTFLGSRTRCLVELEDGTRIRAEPATLPVGLGRGDVVGCRLGRDCLVPLRDPA